MLMLSLPSLGNFKRAISPRFPSTWMLHLAADFKLDMCQCKSSTDRNRAKGKRGYGWVLVGPDSWPGWAGTAACASR
jgi:hypothetical protein